VPVGRQVTLANPEEGVQRKIPDTLYFSKRAQCYILPSCKTPRFFCYSIGKLHASVDGPWLLLEITKDLFFGGIPDDFR
jgi:hypothetical protein